VCDLFAGIGTLGIEALSRGAERVTFVENSRHMIAVLEQNLNRLHDEEPWSIRQMEVAAYLGATQEQYDAILADPPYFTSAWDELFPLIERHLHPGGVFMMEAFKDTTFPEDVDVRAYGKTKIGMWWNTQ
jgi:16S rRNA (guanine966-N2)-methyltransferase